MSLIKKPSELTLTPTLKALIYGQPGIFKTRLALSAPSPLLIDCDNGIHRVNPIWVKDTVQVSKWEDILEVVNNEDLSAYQSIIIDTAGKMLDYLSASLMANDPKLSTRGGALTLQGYGVRKAAFSNFLSKISIMGKHLIFVAHDKEEKDGDTKFVRPEIGGSSGGDLMKEIDLVGYMEAHGKKHTISFDPCEKFYGKNCLNLPSVMEIKDISTAQENTFMTDIINLYKKSLQDRHKLTQDYNAQIEDITEQVGLITNAESANKLIGWVGSFDGFIWDAKLRASYLLRDKAKELNLELGKDKKYHDPDPMPDTDTPQKTKSKAAKEEEPVTV